MAEFDNLKKNMQKRVINVFVSSTFRDMQAERDELVKKIFPQLRKFCEQRGVTWGEVDLRWGITDDQKAEGEVLPLCLAGIEHCRPYFIGILGERYGWIDDKIPANVLEKYDWLKDYKGKSVTELEILHGVLRNPEMADHAFFYFRDPSYLDSINEEDRINYLEVPIEDEINEYGMEKAKTLAEEREKKLLELKNTIRKSGFSFKENYKNPKDLGELVYNDLKDVIDELYPEGEKLDPLKQTKLEHEAFALSRFSIYIEREEYFNRLNEHVENNDPPLVVIGESGSGKSALLANWAQKYTEHTEDKPFILTHYIGATSDSADWASMLRRIMEELKKQFNIQQDIPDNPNELKMEFVNWLHTAAAKGRVILVIDALNQLEDIDGALDLLWLPEYIPRNVRLIVSSLPGRSLDELKKRKWPTLEVKPLDVDERKKLINNYLSQYKKSLAPEMVEYIASHQQVDNPLYLRALLEEIRLHGDHFTLLQKIDHYLKESAVEDLYAKILERYEQDYEEGRENLVKDVFSCLWAARKGLTGNELRDLMGSDGNPLPGAFWYPLYLAAENSMINRGGLLGFSHEYFRNAVYKRYISTEYEKKRYHLLLADYFEKRELGHRKVDELPWQLDKGELWERLKDCICMPGMLHELLDDKKKFELISYWQDIDDKYDIVESYLNSLEDFKKTNSSDELLSYYYNLLGYFLMIYSRLDGSELFYRRALDIREKVLGPEHPETATTLDNLAMTLYEKGDYISAESLYRRALDIREKVLGSEHPETGKTMNNLGLLLFFKEDYDSAESFYRKALEIYGKVFGSEHPETATTLDNLAGLLSRKKNYVDAEMLCRKALEINEKVLGPEHPETATTLGNLAPHLYRKGDFDGAEILFERALKINERVFGSKHPKTAKSLFALGLVLILKNEYINGESLCMDALEINEKIAGQELDTLLILKTIANLRYKRNDYVGAEPLYRRAIEISEELFGPEHSKTILIREDYIKCILKISQ